MIITVNCDISPHSNDKLIFVKKTQCVFCEVRNKFLLVTY